METTTVSDDLPGMTGKPKRRRRTKAEMADLYEAILEVCEEHQPLTVRQAFYRLVVQGVIEKTQKAYKNTVIPAIGKLRDTGEMPFDWIVDNTRLMRKPDSYTNLADVLERNQRFYRKDIWESLDDYVEIWCESDSAAGVLVSVTEKWDVPLMAARGFSSKTFLHGSAQTIYWKDKPTFVYYFGDHDPSGVHIDPSIERGLEQYGAYDFEFRRVAVTAEQITEMNLPGSPPKKTDSRSRSFKGEAVEIEAIPPHRLRALCEACITSHIDVEVLERCRRVEEAERETLSTIVDLARGEVSRLEDVA